MSDLCEAGEAVFLLIGRMVMASGGRASHPAPGKVKMMKKVYIVSSGLYNGYGINGVFTSRLKARRYLRILKRDERRSYGRIKAWPLDQLDTAPAEQLLYLVWMDKAGDSPVQPRIVDPMTFRRLPFYPDSDNLEMRVWASKPEDAMKIVNERRLEIIAANAWADQDWLVEHFGKGKGIR